ncbi:MAG: response regulator [Treponema sp.]|jgi:signal transduction histidine kinase/CheY-like chemotaxis protein/HPt (histidine-containing phosphotransfer) domain-containing protein|nr:response regulator [Treponema sp.]
MAPLLFQPAAGVFIAAGIALLGLTIVILNRRRLDWRGLGWDSVADKLADAVIVIDKKQKIVNVNPAFYACFPGFSCIKDSTTLPEFTAYLRGLIHGVRPRSLLDNLSLPDDPGVRRKFPENDPGLPRQNTGEFTVSRPEKRSFSARWQDIYRGRRLAGRVIILNDISPYRSAINRIAKLKRRAEAASRSKSEFLATVSHEIRTPLTAIMGFSEILLQKDISGNVRADLEKIYNSGSVLLGIISDILDISKIESGNLSLVPAEYEISRLINDTIHLNLVRIGPKPVKFSLDIDDTIPRLLIGDELRVKQILNNLLSNAIKYTDGGDVALDVRWKREGDSDAVLSFKVSDTGQGIKQEDLERIFTRYVQLDNPVNRNIMGTGLGLSITRTLAGLMDGAVTAESEYGRGSTFTAVIRQGIPAAEPIGAETAGRLRQFEFAGSRNQDRRGLFRTRMPDGRILMVDDMQINIDVLRGLAQPYGLTVDGVTDGPGAVELARLEKPRYDLIFMDHLMAGMDGIETARNIRALGTEYAQKVPIVALSANAVMRNSDIFLRNGINDFLAKPVDTQELNEILEKWIPREKQVQGDPESGERQALGQFPHIPGIDVEAGIVNTGGTAEKYRRILKIFLQDTETRLVRLQEVLEKADYEQYALLVHSIKGAFRIIGAMDAADTAARIEEIARSGDADALAAKHGIFTEQLALTMKNVSEALLL